MAPLGGCLSNQGTEASTAILYAGETTVAFGVHDFQDLLRLLDERPEWQAELRRRLLTEEMLDMPALLRRLAEAQVRTVEHLASVSERLDRLTERVEAIVEQLATLAARFDALTERLDRL
jgi:ABC-type transporter Mla subunit MlaD